MYISTYLYIVRNNIPSILNVLSHLPICMWYGVYALYMGWSALSVSVQQKPDVHAIDIYTEIENKARIFRLSTVPGVVVVFTFVYINSRYMIWQTQTLNFIKRIRRHRPPPRRFVMLWRIIRHHMASCQTQCK